MNRRDCLRWLAVTPLLQVGLRSAWASGPPPAMGYQRLLILVELKGGNDALNMLVPYTDPLYYSLRPQLAISRDRVLQLSDKAGLHPSMQALMPLWQAGELGLVQGLGYPQANLSHFRSIEIWDTASRSDEFLQQGWLARVFAQNAPPRNFAADGVIIGSGEIGPLEGVGPRAIVMSNPDQFVRQAKLAGSAHNQSTPALAHLHRVEADIAQAASRLESQPAMPMNTAFPDGKFGATVRTACKVLAGGGNVAVLRLTQTGYDTHQNQADIQASLLRQLSEGLASLKEGLRELGLWDRTLIMSYAEFGRRVKENQSRGTDHGTAATHLVLGGRVKGGLYGEQPRLDQLEDGNLRFNTDFRRLYATAIQGWWGLPADTVLQGKFAPLPVLKA